MILIYSFPNRYGKVFHPTILGHNIISNLVIHEMTNTNLQKNGHEEVPRELSVSACAYNPPLPTLPPLTTAEPATITDIVTPEGSSCEKKGTTLLCTVPREPCGVSVCPLTSSLKSRCHYETAIYQPRGDEPCTWRILTSRLGNM